MRFALASKRQHVWVLRILILLGLAALFHYYRWWWIEPNRIASPVLSVALVLSLVYILPQFVGVWILYLVAGPPRAASSLPVDISVDAFVVTYDEPYELVERTVSAVSEMRGHHRTWLLDDGADPKLQALAESLGAGYLSRSDRVGNKPGNLNSALAGTEGNLIAIFDVDHAPSADFLERTLGYFRNPRVGFVQAMVTFRNYDESWVTRAASEASLDFYNPTSLGMDRLGSATLLGSNAVIRRAALESIKGYQYGLADDLATSIALHAAGWQSVYVAKPLAPGLAPPDLSAWFTQQLKWARGVFEVQLTEIPKFFSRLTWGQRLSYAVRVTYYLAGPFILIHLMLTILLLFLGTPTLRAHFQDYLLHLAPLAIIAMLIRQVALLIWRHPSLPSGLLGRAVSLVYSTWPIYSIAWLLALLRIELPFRLTPKLPADRTASTWLLPQAGTILLLSFGTAYSSIVNGPLSPIFILWVFINTFPQIVLIWYGRRSNRRLAAEGSNAAGGSRAAMTEFQLPADRDSTLADLSSRGS